MHVQSRQSMGLGLIAAFVVQGLALTQPAGLKAVRSGTKTTEPQVVAFVTGTDRIDQLETVADEALKKLRADVGKAGLTMFPRYSMQLDLAGLMGGNETVAWEARVPLINEAPAEGAPAFDGFSVKTIEPTTVAYSFHRGPLNAVEYSIQALIGWMMQNGHTTGPKITLLTLTDPDQVAEEDLVIELRIEVEKQ